MRGPALAILAALAALAAGCDHVPSNAVESCSAHVQVLPASTDILLVIDDSGSMSEEQENLRQNLAAFVTALADSAVPHDFQLGVTTTDVQDFDGTDHYPDRPPYDAYTWPVPYPRGAIVSVNPAALTDPARIGDLVYNPTDGFAVAGAPRILAAGSATLVPDFEANVLLGTQGAGKEQPFHAVELALSDAMTQGPNAGFLRHGARLGVVILTDEDDCSEPAPPFLARNNDQCHTEAVKAQLPPTADFLAFLDGPIAGEERNPVVAIVAGFDPVTLAPTGCATSYEEPTRMAALLEAMGPDRTLRGSICDASFGPVLQRIADLLVPQTVPLDGAPSDAHMLVASVHKADGSAIACPIVAAGEDASQAGAVFAPPREGRPASLTFQRACRLSSGDRIDVQILCAG